jgi:hypothetical protein
VARGIPIDGVIGYLLLKTCYTSIRMLWARTHAQISEQRMSATEDKVATSDAQSASASTARAITTGGAAKFASVAKFVTPEGGGVGGASESSPEWVERMLHALTGRSNVAVADEGVKSARDWRDRAHLVYRCAVTIPFVLAPIFAHSCTFTSYTAEYKSYVFWTHNR